MGDGFAGAGEDSDVAVVDEHEDVLSSVGSSDAEVAEFPGVAQGHFAGLVDAVASDAELAGVAVGVPVGWALTRPLYAVRGVMRCLARWGRTSL